MSPVTSAAFQNTCIVDAFECNISVIRYYGVTVYRFSSFMMHCQRLQIQQFYELQTAGPLNKYLAYSC